MFTRAIATFYFVLSLAILAAAMPGGEPPKTITVTVTSTAAGSSATGSTCSTGPIQCCQQVTQADNPVASLLLGLLGIVLGPDVTVGLTCSPLSVVGIGSGNSW